MTNKLFIIVFHLIYVSLYISMRVSYLHMYQFQCNLKENRLVIFMYFVYGNNIDIVGVIVIVNPPLV